MVRLCSYKEPRSHTNNRCKWWLFLWIRLAVTPYTWHTHSHPATLPLKCIANDEFHLNGTTPPQKKPRTDRINNMFAVDISSWLNWKWRQTVNLCLNYTLHLKQEGQLHDKRCENRDRVFSIFNKTVETFQNYDGINSSAQCRHACVSDRLQWGLENWKSNNGPVYVFN